jgi:hypothetical protein
MLSTGEAMKPYRPSWQIPSDEIITLLLFMLVGSFVIGSVVFAVSHIIYIVWVAPVVIGPIAAVVMIMMVKRLKIHQPILAVILGVLFAIGIVGIIHFGDYYIDFRGEVRASLAKKTGEAYSEGDVDRVMNAFLIQETGNSGFIGYLEFESQQKTGLKSVGTDLSYSQESTVLLWGGELLIIAAIAAGAAFLLARRPFNEQIDDWYDAMEHVGFVDWKHRKEFKKLLKKGDFVNAAKYVQMFSAQTHGLDVGLHRNRSLPNTNMVLVIHEVTQGRLRPLTVVRGMLAPADFAQFFHVVKAVNELQRQAHAQAAASAN